MGCSASCCATNPSNNPLYFFPLFLFSSSGSFYDKQRNDEWNRNSDAEIEREN